MSIPVTAAEVLTRCRRVLARSNRTLVVSPGEAIFEIEYKAGSKVKAVEDLEQLARELQVMEPCEVPGGSWAAEKEKCA